MKDEILKVIDSVFPGHQVSFIDNYDDEFDGWELNPSHNVHMIVLFSLPKRLRPYAHIEVREIVGRYDLSLNRKALFRGPIDNEEGRVDTQLLTTILKNWRHIG